MARFGLSQNCGGLLVRLTRDHVGCACMVLLAVLLAVAVAWPQ